MPEHLRSTVYAFDRCFEGALGATAAPLVGLVAERTFDFSGNLGQSVDAAQAAALSNAHALGKAMLLLLILPWGFDFFVYFGEPLHSNICYKIEGYASDAVNLFCRKGSCSPCASPRPDICLCMACFIAETLRPGLQCPPINTSCAQAYTLQQEAIATGAKVVVVPICIPIQALTHVRWAAAEQPRMCMCSQHIIEVLDGRHALHSLPACHSGSHAGISYVLAS